MNKSIKTTELVDKAFVFQLNLMQEVKIKLSLLKMHIVHIVEFNSYQQLHQVEQMHILLVLINLTSTQLMNTIN